MGCLKANNEGLPQGERGVPQGEEGRCMLLVCNAITTCAISHPASAWHLASVSMSKMSLHTLPASIGSDVTHTLCVHSSGSKCLCHPPPSVLLHHHKSHPRY